MEAFRMERTQPVATLNALIDSLQFDPFYAAIVEGFDDEDSRRRALARYFDYSMTEGAQNGRLVIWPEPSIGAAVWVLPQDRASSDVHSAAKAAFLAEAIGARGAETYRRVIDFMNPRAVSSVPATAWYLSIVGVAPSAQGQGIGARLLQPTLDEADANGVPCFLETFDSRNPRFYQRLGFAAIETHFEPVTGSAYTIMVRAPRSNALTA
jgi:GNAT superfamily N-acetyltransferase